MNWKKRFVSQKLNVKFTLVIILFMVITPAEHRFTAWI